MATLSLSSDFGTQVQLLEQAMNSGALDIVGTHLASIDAFMSNVDLMPMSVVQLSSTSIKLDYEGVDATYAVAITGSGIGPVSSLAELQAAIDSGMATGAVSSIALSRIVSGTSTTILQVDITATGYTVTSGVDVFSVTGAVPDSFETLFEVVGLLLQFDVDALDAMTSVDRAAYFADLSAYGVTGLAVVSDGETLGSISVTPTALTMTIGDMVVVVEGAFPNDFGLLATAVYEAQIYSNFGLPMNLDAFSGLAVTSLTVKGPGDTTLMRVNGPITDDFSMNFTAFTLDGVARGPIDNIELGSPYFSMFFSPGNANDLSASNVIFGSTNADFGDQVYGGYAEDYIFGYEGNDWLFGAYGFDLISGGAGNDVISGGAGNDTLDGGAGNDTLLLAANYDTRGRSVSLSLTTKQATGEGVDLITNFENVVGSEGSDRIIGNSGKNTLWGGKGDDTLRGGAGSDTLFGENGNDVLEGGSGADVLDGGYGLDIFVFTDSSGADRIRDFRNGLDRMQMKGFAFEDITIADAGADALLTFGTSSVRLVGIDHLVIGIEDFLFL